jgi:glutamyl-tRNA synthetase
VSSRSAPTNAAPKTGGVRFAPSPTGRFHIGNLRTAWISFRFARALNLPWVVRFEDIDEPRVLAGAQELQLADMAALGMTPDTSLLQSTFRSRHLSLFQLARSTGAIYPCTCSRREVQTALSGLASASHDGVAPVYSGHCRSHLAAPVAAGLVENSGGIAWRFRMPRLDGRNDFVIARTSTLDSDDGFIPAYHWACAIDDLDGGYDLIVRSLDLAPALPLQRAIQKWLREDAAPSRAFHTSLITQDDGHRLEKRTAGVTLPELQSAGWTRDKIWSAFGRSFDSTFLTSDRFDSDGVAHETDANLKLSQLLR